MAVLPPQVMLDPNGQMVDFLLCAQLSGPMGRTRMEHTVFSDPKKARTVVCNLLRPLPAQHHLVCNCKRPVKHRVHMMGLRYCVVTNSSAAPDYTHRIYPP